jgi:hypothetical protein
MSTGLGLTTKDMDMTLCPTSPKAGISPQLVNSGNYYIPEKYIKLNAMYAAEHPEAAAWKNVHSVSADSTSGKAPASVQE